MDARQVQAPSDGQQIIIQNAQEHSAPRSSSTPPLEPPASPAVQPVAATESDKFLPPSSPMGAAIAAKPSPTLTASPCLAPPGAAVATKSSATCNDKAQADDKRGIENLLFYTNMSLAGITADSMKYAISYAREIYLSFTDKRASLRQVRETAVRSFPDRVADIDTFIRQVRQYDVTSLAKAVNDGDTELVQEHLSDGVKPAGAEWDSEHWPLESAVSKGHEPIVSLLLPLSSNRNILDSLRVLLGKASEERDWNKHVPTARKLIARLKSWEETEVQIGRYLASNRDGLDEEALTRAKGFHRAAFSHLKAWKAVEKSVADAKSMGATGINPQHTVETLVQAVHARDKQSIIQHLMEGVRSVERSLADLTSPLEIAIQNNDAEIFQMLLPHSDNRSALSALFLLVTKVANSLDWEKWIPWGRQIVDQLKAWTSTDAKIAKWLANNRGGFPEKGLARAKAFHEEAFAYFRASEVKESTSVANTVPINTAGAIRAHSMSAASAIPQPSALTRNAMFARIESVNFRLQQASRLEKMEALVAVACEIHFAEKNLSLSHEELVQRNLADPLGGLITEAGLKEMDRARLDRLRTVAKTILNTFRKGPAQEEAMRYVREHAGVFARHIEVLFDHAGKDDAAKS